MPAQSKFARDQTNKENEAQHTSSTTIDHQLRAPSSRQRRMTEKEAQRLAEQEAAVQRRLATMLKQQRRQQKQQQDQHQDSDNENANDEAGSEGDYGHSEDDEINESEELEAEQGYSFSSRTVTSKPAMLKILAQRNNKIPPSASNRFRKETRDSEHLPGPNRKHGRAWTPPGADFDADGLPPDFDDDQPVYHQMQPANTNGDDIYESDYDEANPASQKRSRSQSESLSEAPHAKAIRTGPTTSRPKAGDYDDVTQEILATAISLFRCRICTEAPFPDRITELQFVQDAWKQGYERNGLPPMDITPTLAKLIMSRVSHVRGELKTKIRPLVEIIYGFGSGQGKKTIARNRKLAEDLKEGYNFVYKVTNVDSKLRKGLYQNKIIQKAINSMWFSNRKDEGVSFREYFDPFPANSIALVLTAIECGIDEWATGIRTDVQFTAADYHSVYESHLKSLQDFDHHTHSHRLLHSLQIKLHDAGRVHAGAQSAHASTAPVLSMDAFNAAIREFEDATTEDSDDDE